MNLHPTTTASPPAPAEWTIQFSFQPGLAVGQHLGIISRNGFEVCRLSTTGSLADLAEAQLNLAEKARAWIAEFLRRESERSGGDRQLYGGALQPERDSRC
jgi:hypothetical protein